MPETVKVLFWGTAVEGPCAYFRGYMFDEPWKALGIEARHITNVRFHLPPEYHGREVDAARDGRAALDTTDIDWADVIVLRRYYNTTQKCRRCVWLSTDVQEGARHRAETGHEIDLQDTITRTLWPAIATLTSKAIIYETDDRHVLPNGFPGLANWNGYYVDVAFETDLVRAMASRADLVTVATPVLARLYGHFNDEVRVIRNAIDPTLYVADEPRPAGDLPRVGYYGGVARWRDFAGDLDSAGKQIGGEPFRAVQRYRNAIRTAFLGWEPKDDPNRAFSLGFDELHEYVASIPGFARALANLHLDIGLAPLVGDDFDAAKSELHWLEYSATGAATIATAFRGAGPYDVIRHGVDGLLARTGQEWQDALRRLLRNPAEMTDIAAAAKERVLREYDYRQRAHEWAGAFRWAAEHAGRRAAYGREIPTLPYTPADAVRLARAGRLFQQVTV